jgi:prepilin-type N-terminal cleavage/methylation domain-containing protein
MKKHQGFTLIEVILVIALFAMIGLLAAPVLSKFLTQTYLQSKTQEVESALRTAQINSVSGKANSKWGVNISNSSIKIYKGNSFATRDASADITYDIPGSVTITSTDVNFDKLTGKPNSAATIVISSSVGTKTVTLNAAGTVDSN